MITTNNVKALKSGIWYTAANFIMKGIGFITMPIFTRLLSHEDFGLHKVLLHLLQNFCPESVRPFARKVFFFGKYNYYKLLGNVFAGKLGCCCPCCGIKLISFIDERYYDRSDRYNQARYNSCRQDVICPFCGSLPRHRILATWCDKNIVRLKGKRILYFALEKSMLQWLLRKRIDVTSADILYKADLQLDLNDIKQPDCSWDVVFCNHVLEHVSDYKKALKELYRILMPGGRMICSFPIDIHYDTVYEDISLINAISEEADKERISKFGQKDHLRVFGCDSEKILEAAGFEVSVIDGDSMPSNILPVVGPADYDSNKLFLCVKRL